MFLPQSLAPYMKAHELLMAAGKLMADPDWDREQHQALWEEFFPPKNEPEEKVIFETCMGHAVPEELVRKAREWKA